MKCNLKTKAKSIISAIDKNLVISKDFTEQHITHCKHSAVAEVLFTREKAISTEEDVALCHVIVGNTKHHIAACFDGKTHGLVCVNLARGGNKGKCSFCKSIRCGHVKPWNLELKNDVLKEKLPEENEQSRRDEEENKEDTNEDDEDKSNMRMKIPISSHTQKLMQMADAQEYDSMENLVSDHIEGTSCIKHKNLWDSRDPVENNWFYASQVIIAHSKFVKPSQRKIFYRPTTGKCNCQLPYNGEDNMLLEVGGLTRTRRKNGPNSVASVVSLSLLFDYSLEFFETGQTMRGFHRTYRAKCMIKYGMAESEILCWIKWRKACNIFWKDILVMDLQEAYICKSCGPRPKTLVVDGIALGIQTKQLRKYMNKLNLFSPFLSPSILKGSIFRDRMFVKKQTNRDIIRQAAVNRTWPTEGPKVARKEHDPEFQPGKKRNREEENDEGMEIFWKYLLKIDKTYPPKQGMVDLMLNLSTKTSTTSIFQVVDEDLLDTLISYLKGSKSDNFVRGTDNLHIHQNMKSKYPIIANIIINLANNSGHLEKPEAELILAIVNHTKQVYNSALKRNPSNYYKRTVGELDSQVFPNMPLLKERAKYDKTCKTEDSRAWKKLCEKTFPTHKNLTPGLFIVTCACSLKVMYGFSMMLSGESPQMLFDIIMTRFEEDYNPNIIYDASCKLKDRHGKSQKQQSC